MDRRGFLIHTARAGSVLLVLPAGWSVLGCDTNGDNDKPTTVVAAGPVLRFTSGVAQNHTHDFSIATADLSGPPQSGISGTTTVTLGHFHMVTLSQSLLSQIQAGGTVNTQTTVVDGHSHTFQFSLATGQTGTVPSTTSGGGATPSPIGVGMNPNTGSS
jgi:hypothetical protein